MRCIGKGGFQIQIRGLDDDIKFELIRRYLDYKSKFILRFLYNTAQKFFLSLKSSFDNLNPPYNDTGCINKRKIILYPHDS